MLFTLHFFFAQLEFSGSTDVPLHTAILYWTLHAVVATLGLAMLLVVIRLLRGPSLPDRVIALDMVGAIAAGAIAVYAVREDQPVYLYVAVVLALVIFVGTTAFGYYLEKGIRRAPVPHRRPPAERVNQAASDPATPPPPPEPPNPPGTNRTDASSGETT